MNAPLQDHYTTGTLLSAIEAGLRALGLSPENVSADDLAPADEFHIGGREATVAFFEGMTIAPADRLLDIGCGLGGPARYVARTYGCRVAGVDRTAEFVETGRELNRWVGLEDRVELAHGDATDTPFEEASFDGAYMLHVGMNIPDKQALFREAFRLLKPGAWFDVYEICRTGEGELALPLPWASTPAISHVVDLEAYERAMGDAGFGVRSTENRLAFALTFFERMLQRAREAGPPPLGLQTHMGPEMATKFQHLIQGLKDGVVAPFTMRAVKPAR
ncbi:MAG: class I SAM-dependent methyltransferase [Rhodothermales bacterium]